MAADLHIHALVPPCTEENVADFCSSHLGSKHFKWGGGAARDYDDPDGAWRRVSNTPHVWVGEVSWLKAAVTGDPESFIPDFVQAVAEAIGEDLPVIDDALIDRLRGAYERTKGSTAGAGYTASGWGRIGEFLDEQRGHPAFTVSW